jgi:hypothetical protein
MSLGIDKRKALGGLRAGVEPIFYVDFFSPPNHRDLCQLLDDVSELSCAVSQASHENPKQTSATGFLL